MHRWHSTQGIVFCSSILQRVPSRRCRLSHRPHYFCPVFNIQASLNNPANFASFVPPYHALHSRDAMILVSSPANTMHKPMTGQCCTGFVEEVGDDRTAGSSRGQCAVCLELGEFIPASLWQRLWSVMISRARLIGWQSARDVHR